MTQVPPVVKFLGEDLVVTLNLMPKAERIVIVPDIVYHYRPGGGTSRYNPDMMEDWIALYNYKAGFAQKYPMQQPIEKLMDIELCNMTFTYLEMCARSGGLDEDAMKQEIAQTLAKREVQKAANNPDVIEHGMEKARLIREKKLNEINAWLFASAKAAKKKEWIRKIYYSLA
jgi:hypothetical protein